jgi:hypothetical protein
MGRSSYIIGVGPKCNHRCPYERDAVGDFIVVTEASVMTEERCFVDSLEDRGLNQQKEIK